MVNGISGGEAAGTRTTFVFPSSRTLRLGGGGGAVEGMFLDAAVANLSPLLEYACFCARWVTWRRSTETGI